MTPTTGALPLSPDRPEVVAPSVTARADVRS
jgi:hypothetical protein